MVIRDRIKELRRVPASSLVVNPENWREHPPEQRAALRAVLEAIGFAGAELTVELPDGRLMLIDGHLRREEAGDQIVPVLVTDLTENEAREMLATFDPIGAMATTNSAAVDALLGKVQLESPALKEMFRRLSDDAKDVERSQRIEDPDGETLDRLRVTEGYKPRHEVKRGEVFRISDRHFVACLDVMNDWRVWGRFLEMCGDAAMFCPYGGPLVLLTATAKVRPVVIVHPLPFVCGVILDWVEDASGPEAITNYA